MPPRRVLFLCTGNSARSILAEATLNHLGGSHFVAFSAGSQPAGRVHPGALAQLTAHGIATDGLTSKSWDRFAQAGAANLDIVITVCDNAARESCPIFPGDVLRSHWSLPDPAAIDGAQTQRAAFDHVHQQIIQRLNALLALPLASLSRGAVQRALDHIGTLAAATEPGHE